MQFLLLQALTAAIMPLASSFF